MQQQSKIIHLKYKLIKNVCPDLDAAVKQRKFKSINMQEQSNDFDSG